jgi:hypothetical protein
MLLNFFDLIYTPSSVFPYDVDLGYAESNVIMPKNVL